MTHQILITYNSESSVFSITHETVPPESVRSKPFRVGYMFLFLKISHCLFKRSCVLDCLSPPKQALDIFWIMFASLQTVI